MNKGAVTPPFNFPMKKKKYMEKVKKKFRLRRNKGAVSWVSTDTVNPPPPSILPPKKRTFRGLSRQYAQGLQSARRKAAILS